MNDVKSPPPFACFLKGELESESVNLDNATQDVQVSLSPFNEVDLIECSFCPSHIQPLGFQVERCPRFLCAYVSAFDCPFGPHDTFTANHQHLGGHILKVGKCHTFTPDDIQAALQSHASLPSSSETLSILIARDP